MNETTKNFLQVFTDWKNVADVKKPVTFKLYYNELGRPICYSMDELEGSYIEIDRIFWQEADMNVLVKDGKVVKLPKKNQIHKLVPGLNGVSCLPNHIDIVVKTPNSTKWEYRPYASN